MTCTICKKDFSGYESSAYPVFLSFNAICCKNCAVSTVKNVRRMQILNPSMTRNEIFKSLSVTSHD